MSELPQPTEDLAQVKTQLKDEYPDRAVIYCFLIGIFMLGLGYVFSYLLNDDRIRLRRPTTPMVMAYSPTRSTQKTC